MSKMVHDNYILFGIYNKMINKIYIYIIVLILNIFYKRQILLKHKNIPILILHLKILFTISLKKLLKK